MGIYVERARELRNHPTVHYNCGQSVLVAFDDKMGYTEDQMFAMGANLGGGMKHGSTCGALAGALLVLGALGYDPGTASSLIGQFHQSHGTTLCHQLLQSSRDRGVDKISHCNDLVLEMVAAIEALIDPQEVTV